MMNIDGGPTAKAVGKLHRMCTFEGAVTVSGPTARPEGAIRAVDYKRSRPPVGQFYRGCCAKGQNWRSCAEPGLVALAPSPPTRRCWSCSAPLVHQQRRKRVIGTQVRPKGAKEALGLAGEAGQCFA